MSQMAEQPKKKVEVETPKTYLEELEQKAEVKKETSIDLVNKIKEITEVGELDPYINHEMKTVRNAAEKRFNELTGKQD